MAPIKDQETIPCPFCQSTDYSIYDKNEEWQIVRCSKCDFTYTNPRPTIEALPHYYSEEYFKDERHRAKFYNEDGTIKAQSDSYINRIQDIEQYFDKRGAVLEVGAARGGLLNELKKRGWQVKGVEISQDACNQAKILYDIDMFCGVLSEYNTDEKFDVICMYQTLEHVPDPKEVLEKAYSLLKPNGVVVVEIPNRNCFESRYSSERKRLSYDLPRHLNHFTPAFLSNEMEKMGYKIVEIERNEHPIITSYLQRKHTGTVSSSTPSGNSAATTSANIPMARKPATMKAKLLASFNKVIPGWRFTVTGRK